MEKNAKCCICDSNCVSLQFDFKNSVTSDNRFITKDISYSYCECCDYIFVDYDKRVDLEEFYKNDYDFLLESDDIEPQIDGVKYSEYIVDFFSEYIVNDKNKMLLDIGAGKGNLLESFYKKFKNLSYFAVEPSNAFFKLNQKSFIKEKVHGFFIENIFHDKKFDFITLVEVLEHVPNPKSFLMTVAENMHSESLMLVEVPNFENHKSDILTIDHLSLFNPYNLNYLFQVCGFEVVKYNIGNRVPMQFIVKLNKKRIIHNNHYEKKSLLLFEQAIQYINKIITDTKLIEKDLVAIYGHNVLLDYLIGNQYLALSKIECIINDNKLYQGKKRWNAKIDIVSFEEFMMYGKSKKVLLSMNDCYHEKILQKLKNYTVLGAKIDALPQNISKFLDVEMIDIDK